MSGFEVNITMNIERFEAAITDWRDKVVAETALASADAADFIASNLRELLTRYPHPRSVPTPREAFIESPGMVSGRLAGSVHEYPMAIGGFWKVDVTAPWARIQEIGGWTGEHHATYIPPRPYFFPTVVELDTTGPGGLEHIYYQHWKNAFEAAVALRPPGINPPRL